MSPLLFADNNIIMPPAVFCKSFLGQCGGGSRKTEKVRHLFAEVTHFSSDGISDIHNNRQDHRFSAGLVEDEA